MLRLKFKLWNIREREWLWEEKEVNFNLWPPSGGITSDPCLKENAKSCRCDNRAPFCCPTANRCTVGSSAFASSSLTQSDLGQNRTMESKHRQHHTTTVLFIPQFPFLYIKTNKHPKWFSTLLQTFVHVLYTKLHASFTPGKSQNRKFKFKYN